MEAVGLVDPAGQLYPAKHPPLHADDVTLLIDPYRPPGHSLQVPAPDAEYVPAGHFTVVAITEPSGQLYPALQAPLQLEVVSSATEPYRPAPHCPEHASVVNPYDEPYWPASHGKQKSTPKTPPRLYRPGVQIDAVAFVDPAAHAYPAAQGPVHDKSVKPLDDPY